MAHHVPPFSGLWPAMITPFDAEDRLNLRAAIRLTGRLLEQGAAGLYLCGSSGEGPLLRAEERKSLVECVIGEVAGQVPVMVHVGHTSPPLALDLAEHAVRCGADALSSTLPPFYPYNAAQIAAYFGSLTRGHDLPFYGYVMTDLGQSRSQVFRWLDVVARTPGLVGMKFTHADAHQLALLKAWENGRLNVFSGHDQGYLACRVQGADGAIGTSYNIALPMWLQVSRLYEAGDQAGATAAMIRCCCLVGRLIDTQFLAAVKMTVKRLGIDCGLTRFPFRPDAEIPDATINEVVAMLEPESTSPVGLRSAC